MRDLAQASHGRFGGEYADHLAFAYSLPSSEKAEAIEKYVRHVLPKVKAKRFVANLIAHQASLRDYGTMQECLTVARRIMAES